MGTRTSEGTLEHERMERLVDQLVPPQGPPWRRFVVGVSLTALVLASGLAWALGYVFPRHAAWGDYAGTSTLRYVPQRHAFAASIYVHNFSWRDLRLAAVTLDASGVRLLDAGIRLRPDRQAGHPGSTATTCDLAGADPNCPEDSRRLWVSGDTGLLHLPATIPAGADLDLEILISPSTCTGPTALPWGRIFARFDFGAGAFPFWSHTERIHSPLLDTGGLQDIQEADGTSAASDPAFAHDSPLAAACRLMQRQ